MPTAAEDDLELVCEYIAMGRRMELLEKAHDRAMAALLKVFPNDGTVRRMEDMPVKYAQMVRRVEQADDALAMCRMRREDIADVLRTLSPVAYPDGIIKWWLG